MQLLHCLIHWFWKNQTMRKSPEPSVWSNTTQTHTANRHISVDKSWSCILHQSVLSTIWAEDLKLDWDQWNKVGFSLTAQILGPCRHQISRCYPRLPDPANTETNAAVLKRRQKQIQYGKNTSGYQNYLQQVPKWGNSRSHSHSADSDELVSAASHCVTG